MSIPAESPAVVHRRMQAGEDVTLIDVREPEEVAVAFVKGALIRPMSQAAQWIDALPREGTLVIMCHHGIRSLQVARALAERGHTNVVNMSGGIDLWSIEVDSEVARY